MAVSRDRKAVTFRAPEDLVDELDDYIIQLKASGELDRDVSRSDFLRKLVEKELED